MPTELRLIWAYLGYSYGRPRQQLRAYYCYGYGRSTATGTGVLRLWLRAYYDYGYGRTTTTATGVLRLRLRANVRAYYVNIFTAYTVCNHCMHQATCVFMFLFYHSSCVLFPYTSLTSHLTLTFIALSSFASGWMHWQ